MNPQVLTYLPLVSPVATLVVVVLGVFNNRHVDVRISDLRSRMDARCEAEIRVNDGNFKLLLSKIEDMDTRLTRLEERFHR